MNLDKPIEVEAVEDCFHGGRYYCGPKEAFSVDPITGARAKTMKLGDRFMISELPNKFTAFHPVDPGALAKTLSKNSQ